MAVAAVGGELMLPALLQVVLCFDGAAVRDGPVRAICCLAGFEM